ncbi:ABC transporter ATP-binding protein [Clostridiaceae bacterium M8S5]|nr:ABC transporter ATP-binding protein [Clostridiaceae bacterium M8S5]
MHILSINNLSKKFGSNKVIDNLSLSLTRNTVLGFLGQNGAGKTTTMKMILGLLKPTSGCIEVCGEKVVYGQNDTNKYIGYLPDVPKFYGYMKSTEYLSICGKITGMTNKSIELRSKELLKLVGLDGIKKPISSYSRGMKQRLGIAQALLNNPQLLICDEPTSALDPVGRNEILNILRQVSSNITVIFSTHILSDVEQICDEIAILHDGVIVKSGKLSNIKSENSTNRLKIVFNSINDLNVFVSCLNLDGLSANIKEFDNTILLQTSNMQELAYIALSKLKEKSIIPRNFHILDQTLEDLYMEVIQ